MLVHPIICVCLQSEWCKQLYNVVSPQFFCEHSSLRIFYMGVFPLPPQQGGPPEPWEEAIGDTGERVGRQGRAVVEYAAKMNAMGINERSPAGDNNPVADHVATIGQDKMRLLSGVPAAPARVTAALEGDGAEGWRLFRGAGMCERAPSCFAAVVNTNGRGW